MNTYTFLTELALFGYGLLGTFKISIVTLVATTLISVIFGSLSTVDLPWLRFIIRGYVECFRSIPLVVIVFFIYFTLPLLGLTLPPFLSVSVGLTFWASANGIEIVRGGIASVAKGQRESAASLGLSAWKIYLLIIWPQALRAIIPAYLGQITLLIQASSLGALVGVDELFLNGKNYIEQTTLMSGNNPSFFVYAGILATYFVICSLFTQAGRLYEKRVGKKYQ
ncbi:amino acid ABC transporter permease [Brenneria goodwinii]|uniref:Amino acid ABC transporter, permease protein n=1 Tax=Brenneria goodwinii TaxID=1109412 RepID=A0A0G4JTN4_9GAMM|nr:amino acid ABC transporter permease [Brenneria goodwinii]MCG8158802.1 amino acid ABC transporter permease [Brenneria goodwinii]MCG8163395.1 amino acid ABC transporter permease [Brenneria goodwinii]MCG8167931.1 amino acid ABC transporter permease [Brenneria goodwinii]MCG8172546.1 amino acid ABC transporter permease [Brenneria goodwinii]MCG8177260.1 amino acid ABC transporter permease [Brenneria goodwinii]